MPSEKQKQYRNKWDAANMTNIACRVRKDKAERFKAACKENGTTPNAVLLDTVNRYLGEEEEQ